MKTLYLECKMGIAGDMLTAALVDLFDDQSEVVSKLNAMNVPNVEYILETDEKCGIHGKHMKVLVYGQEEEVEEVHSHSEHSEHHHVGHDHEEHVHGDEEHIHSHEHHSLYDIEDIIENLSVGKDIKSDIREVYQLLAEAEGSVHGKPVSQIHFHEVGNMDAIADISAVCYLLHELDADKVVVSPINVGSGTVKCAHGILPVPAPATAYLLNGIPSYESSTIQTELCTPTGAALVKYFAFDFAPQPVMEVKKIGYGMGKKDFPQANCVRALLGETVDEVEQIIELTCNIDDMTSEEIGFATSRLMELGAIDVYTIAIGMKKNRPGVQL
nr:LarC family nickel insertion protein [Treponema sp.]